MFWSNRRPNYFVRVMWIRLIDSIGNNVDGDCDCVLHFLLSVPPSRRSIVSLNHRRRRDDETPRLAR